MISPEEQQQLIQDLKPIKKQLDNVFEKYQDKISSIEYFNYADKDENGEVRVEPVFDITFINKYIGILIR